MAAGHQANNGDPQAGSDEHESRERQAKNEQANQGDADRARQGAKR